MRILYIPLEYSSWMNARRASYIATLGLEEGFAANNVSYTTVPAIRELSSNDRGSWLRHIRTFCKGKLFDQAWITIPHAEYDKSFLEWFATVAPIRVGYMHETLQVTEEEWLRNAIINKDRQVKTETALKYITHALVVDETEVDYLAQAGIPAFWNPCSVPQSLIADHVSLNLDQPALFYGALYGERKKWFEEPALRGLINTHTGTDEDNADYPNFLERIISLNASYLSSGMDIDSSLLDKFLNNLRQTRIELIKIYLKSLQKGSAVINFPQPPACYSSRVFEGMAAGRPVITAEIPNRPLTKSLFENDKEIILYDRTSPQTLADAIRKVKADPDRAHSIVRNSQGKLKRLHTSEARIRQILDWIETGNVPEYYNEKSNSSSIKLGKKDASTKSTFLDEIAVYFPERVSETGQMRLHLGCGEQHLEGYINIDYPQEYHTVQKNRADLFFDITKLSFPYQSVDEIRLHHVFEHFDRAIGLGLLIKWHLWLKPGGILHLETPDVAGSAARFLTDADYKEKQAIIRHMFGSHEASWAYHLDGWHEERFINILSKMGFEISSRHLQWKNKPRLSNIEVTAKKVRNIDQDTLIGTAKEILKDYTVADVPNELAMHSVWFEKMKSFVLDDDHPQCSIQHGIKHCLVLVFSKNRAMQLDCMLKTLLLHCKDIEAARICVLYEATAERFEKQYEALKSDFPSVIFEKVCDFNTDLAKNISEYRFTFFASDDCIFCRDFSIKAVTAALGKNSDAIGFLLGLGKNTTIYIEDGRQALPAFVRVSPEALSFDWTTAHCDFKLPFSATSAVYRTAEILPLISQSDFGAIADVETLLNTNKGAIAKKHRMLCFETSIAFCNAINSNRAAFNKSGSYPEHSHEFLADLYDRGFRIDIEPYYFSFIPKSYHQEVNIKFVNKMDKIFKTHEFNEARPVSSIIIFYRSSCELLKKCMDSISRNTQGPYEIIVVHDGRKDGSLEYLQTVNNVVLLENPASPGFALARAQGMSIARGDYIILLDDNTLVTKDWLRRFIELAKMHPNIGVFGAVSNCATGPQHLAGTKYNNEDELEKFAVEVFEKHKYAIEYAFRVESYCMLVNKRTADAIGAFDSRSELAGYEDDDYSFRAYLAGLFPVVAKGIFIHRTGDPVTQGEKQRGWDRFKEKWNIPKDTAYGTSYLTVPLASQSFEKKRHYIQLPGRSSVEKLVHQTACAQGDKKSIGTNAETQKLPRIVSAVSGPSAQSAKGLVFSKDRAMQLDCTLRSFFLHCSDPDNIRLSVLYKSSTPNHESQYQSVKQAYPSVRFISESNFRNDTLSLLDSPEYVLFLVDDNIFARRFSIRDITDHLKHNSSTLGFSLRLGKNTTYCYMLGKQQALPAFERLDKAIMKYDWTSAELDFGYPLELSSSVYRAADIKPFLDRLDFMNPNTLELAMDTNKAAFTNSKHDLLCFEQSVAFCNPVNMVQTMWTNRAGRSNNYTAEKLSELFGEGYRINAGRFSGFVPVSCHQEVEFEYTHESAPSDARVQDVVQKKPLVTIGIANYNGIQHIKLCLDSIRRNTPEPHEVIVVDNGSTDGSREYLREQTDIVLVENADNVGAPGARNQFMSIAKGAYIVFLDNDTIVTKDWIKKLVAHMETDAHIGIIGACSNYATGLQGIPGVTYKTIEELEDYAAKREREHRSELVPSPRLISFCVFVRRAAIEKIGGMETGFSKFCFEDDDYSLRISIAGFKSVVANDVFIHHTGGPQGRGDKKYNKWLIDAWEGFKRKWGLPKELPFGSSYDANGIVTRPFDPKLHYIPLPDRAAIMKLIFPEPRVKLPQKEDQAQIDARSDSREKKSIADSLKAAREFYQKDQLDKAVESLIEAIKSDPLEIAIYLTMAEILLDAKRFQAAFDALISMPENAKGDTKSITLVGYCKAGMGLLDEAQDFAARALSLHPDYAVALNLKGIIASKRGEGAEAEAFFRKAITSDPGYGEPYTNIGELKWHAGEKEEALSLFEKGYLLSPTVSDVLTLYQTAITEMGQYSSAERVMADIVAANPYHKKLSFSFISVLLALGRHADAMREIEQAMLVFGVDDGILSAALTVRDKVGLPDIQKSKTGKGTLSVCMLVKNAEEHLARCLMSLKPISNEIIVVDTGSTDRTMDIARAFGAKVHDFQWMGDFSHARNYSLSRASGQWILVMAADEVISSLDYDALNKLTTNGAKAAAYTFITRNYMASPKANNWNLNDGKYLEETGKGWLASSKVRLFPNDGRIRYENAAYEVVEETIKKAGLEILSCAVPIHRYGDLDEGCR